MTIQVMGLIWLSFGMGAMTGLVLTVRSTRQRKDDVFCTATILAIAGLVTLIVKGMP